MKRFKTLLLCLLLSHVSLAQEGRGPFEFDIKKISDDIYIAQRPEPLRAPVEGNVTIIINEKDVVVIEATGSPEGGRNIIREIKKLTDKPVSLLINTHGHGDHTLGNEAFVEAYPGVEVISHSETRNYMTATEGGITYVHNMVANPQRGVDNMSREIDRLTKAAAPGYEQLVEHLKRYRDHDLPKRVEAYSKLKIIPATTTVDDSLTIYRGDREIQIFHPGHGDTKGDLWVYLPEEKLICTGDAVVHPIPYGFSKTPFEWLATLKKVNEMDINIMVPGHGEIQYDKQYLEQLIALLTDAAAQIEKGVDKKMSIQELNEVYDLSAFEKIFAGDDPIKKYYFRNYFRNPYGRNVFQLLSQKQGG